MKVKVISGTLKGSVLKLPKAGLRPTQERVKKSCFDILGRRVLGANVLDCFAGGGNLGIEALSRGANRATFIEWESAPVLCLKKNLERLRLAGRGEVLQENCFKAIRRLLRHGAKFDLVFVDPPYNIEVTTKFLRSLSRCDILTPSALVVVRHPKQEVLPAEEGLRLIRQEQYGRTAVSFFEHSHDQNRKAPCSLSGEL